MNHIINFDSPMSTGDIVRVVLFVLIMIGAVASFIARVVEGYKTAEAKRLANDQAKKNGPLS